MVIPDLCKGYKLTRLRMKRGRQIIATPAQQGNKESQVLPSRTAIEKLQSHSARQTCQTAYCGPNHLCAQCLSQHVLVFCACLREPCLMTLALYSMG